MRINQVKIQIGEEIYYFDDVKVDEMIFNDESFKSKPCYSEITMKAKMMSVDRK